MFPCMDACECQRTLRKSFLRHHPHCWDRTTHCAGRGRLVWLGSEQRGSWASLWLSFPDAGVTWPKSHPPHLTFLNLCSGDWTPVLVLERQAFYQWGPPPQTKTVIFLGNWNLSVPPTHDIVSALNGHTNRIATVSYMNSSLCTASEQNLDVSGYNPSP